MKKYFNSILFFVLLLTSSYSFAQFDRSKRTNDNGENNSNTNTNTNQSTNTNSNNTEEEPEIKGFDKRKMIYGGFIYPGYNYGLRIEASAMIGYRFTKKFAAGVSGVYYYSSYSGVVYDPSGYPIGNGIETTRAAGFGLWAKYLLLQDFHGLDIYASAMPEQNNYRATIQFPGYTNLANPVWYSSFLIGGGIRQRIGGNFFVNLSFYYDALQNNPIYLNTMVYRVGFSSGF